LNEKIKEEVESENFKYDFKFIKTKLTTSDTQTHYMKDKDLMLALNASINAD